MTGRPGGASGTSRVMTMAATAALTLAIAGGAAWQLGWLRPPGGGGGAESGATGGRKLLFYRNPMNPAITSAVPAKDEMGMDYLPVYADEGGAPEKPRTVAEETEDFFADAPPQKVEGLAGVTLGERGIALAGVQTVTAARQDVRRTVRTVGRIVPDETAVRHVHTKIGGYVEKLHVNFSGQYVKRGSPLLDLYSPDILATQEELLGGLRSAARLTAPGDAPARAAAEGFVAAARRRLALYDVPAEVIAAIEGSGTALRAVTLAAPASGFVTSKGIVEGQQVEPGVELYTLTDLSRVWVEADVYEQEARSARIGQEATLGLPYDPGLSLRGKVTYVLPVLDPQSRTIKVRLEFPNPEMALKPGMFVDVTFTLDASEGVAVPDSAVIDSGTRQVVFVGLGGGRFEPRLVRLGTRGEGMAEVLEGVAAGEEVVVRANFLLDSESRLRSLVEQATATTR